MIIRHAITYSDDEPCTVCDARIGSGDEPGAVFMDNGFPVPVCSVACTNVHYSEEG